MEKPLKLKGTKDTPQVVFDASKNKFSLSGRSLPEDAAEFYEPVIEWIASYVKEPNPSTEFRIELEYFNSSSLKQIVVLLRTLEEIIETGNEIKVVWCYNENDDLMEEKGNDFKNMFAMPFELLVC